LNEEYQKRKAMENMTNDVVVRISSEHAELKERNEKLEKRHSTMTNHVKHLNLLLSDHAIKLKQQEEENKRLREQVKKLTDTFGKMQSLACDIDL
jgi:uncharacterized coiled-coil protein SlyX